MPTPSVDCAAQQIEPLKAQVANLVARHASSRYKKPPFSVGELIVMAVVLAGQTSIGRSHAFTKAKALKWILRHFPYWNDRVIERYVAGLEDNFSTDWEDWQTPDYCVIPEFHSAFDLYGLPLRQHGYEDTTNKATDAKYTLSNAAARYYLRDRIEPARRGTFPFTKLPAELRNIIYEMVLRFPNPGLAIGSRMSATLIQSPRRMDEDDVEYGPLDSMDLDYGNGPLPRECSHSQDHVDVSHGDTALLRVCKQIYGEAMPIFYSTNAFYIYGTEALHEFTSQVPKLGIDSIRQLHLAADFPARLGPNEPYEHWLPLCRRISAMKLDVLALRVEDHTWLKMAPRGRRTFLRSSPFTKIQQIPGFSDLASAAARAKTFVLHGSQESCGAIRAYFEKEIAGIKADGATTQRARRGRKHILSAERVVDDEEKPSKKRKAKQDKKKRALATQ